MRVYLPSPKVCEFVLLSHLLSWEVMQGNRVLQDLLDHDLSEVHQLLSGGQGLSDQEFPSLAVHAPPPRLLRELIGEDLHHQSWRDDLQSLGLLGASFALPMQEHFHERLSE
jgi:hypothetical protein